jgi:uncharacterized protein YjiS (DUF1127 family)
MAYATHTLSQLTLSARLQESIESLRAALRRRRVYNKTYRELSALTSRELEDLGIARSMIRRLAMDAAYGK